MKRALFVSIPIVALTLALPTAGGAGREAAGVASFSPSAAPAVKEIRIVIVDAPQGGAIVIRDPGNVTLSKRDGDKILWCVVNNANAAKGATVTISGFRDPDDPKTKNPFGDGSDEANTFVIAPVDYGCRRGTGEATAGVVNKRYKYDITLTLDGAVRGSLDPMVIIGE